MSLTTKTNFYQPNARVYRGYRAADDFYEELINMHRDLSDDQSMVVNTKLVLLLSNHIGDLDVLREAMEAARSGIDASVKTESEKAQ